VTLALLIPSGSVPAFRTLDTPADLKRRLEAERDGMPFVFFHDGEGKQHIIALDRVRDSLSVGRDDDCDVRLGWDERVSRLHARLERSGGSWTVYDGGLSRNGTFLNGERVSGPRVLKDGDQLCFGTTEICFRDTSAKQSSTVSTAGFAGLAVSPAQRKVLIALCRPYKDHSAFAKPASNREIAEELVLSVESVKTHLRALFAKFGLDDLPQNEKRVRLVEQAFVRGLVHDSDL
jgi:DNA-binding CsgD family transcriptional regulator